MAGGQSCTFVGTEYECPFPGQVKKFAARIEYFDIEAIRDLLERLLQDYNMWNFEQLEDWDDDERLEYKRLSSTAFSTFRSLFCDKEEFESPRAGQEFLRGCYVAADKHAITNFVGWCAALLEEKEADEADHIEYIDGDTQPELLQRLNPLVSSSSRFEEPTLWPLVKKVRIGIEGVDILKYIIVVDLPGLDDTNQVRVNASLDMMRSCDSIWVVTKIDRAITETSVDALLMRWGKSYNMVVICTCTDDNINLALAKHLQSEGQSVGDHDELYERERVLRELVKRYRKKIEIRKAKLEGRNNVREEKKRKPLADKAVDKLHAQIAQLEADLKIIEEELPRVANERFDLLVDARNANTTRRLQEEKSDHLTAGKTLEVFCVSNSHYAALKGVEVIHGPRLNADATGIPALRKYILECAAPVVLQTMEDYISHSFTVFMKGLAMWAKSYSIEGSAELLQMVKQPQGVVDGITLRYLDSLMQANTAIITTPLYGLQSSLIAGARSVLHTKRIWNWSTTRAFIRKDGNHKTSVAPRQSWNEQFLQGAIDLTHDQWDVFITKQMELGDQLEEDLTNLITGIHDSIQSEYIGLCTALSY